MGTSITVHVFWFLVSVLCCCYIAAAQTTALNRTSVVQLLLKLKGTGSSLWDTSNQDPCKWPGVDCSSDASSDVTHLSLSGLLLKGIIAPEIGLLQSLITLDASNNSLTGTIPSSLGNLLELQVLDLSQNRLSGSIPEELGNLKLLRTLNLEFNNLAGSIIEGISNLTALRELSLSRNSLSGKIPPRIGELPNLEHFSAYENNLTGDIPPMKMPSLNLINLGSNSLTGNIPANLCSGRQLSVLTLTINRLSGPIPEDLGLCSNLSALRLGYNALEGQIPESFGKLQNLTYFTADQNHLAGEMPKDISGWKNLNLLSLSHNNLTGRIPTQWSKGSSLQELVLSDNMFTGEIPQQLLQCKNLSLLQLSSNRLTGSLPSDICTLPLLTSLRLDRNNLSGAIPTSIGSCSGLLELQLGVNQLSGNIPAQIGNLSYLQVSLDLSVNALTGPIPESLGALVRLVQLDLSYNQLSGRIPESLAMMVSLIGWNFSNNRLTGPVPMGGPLGWSSAASSFANNSGLCGGPLPPCVVGEFSQSAPIEKHNARAFWKAAGISIACGLFILFVVSGIVLAVMHKRHFTTAVDPVPPVTVSHLFSEDVERASDFESIKAAVGSNSNIISTNHFSTLYKAVMPSGLVLAVKKLNSTEKGLVMHQRKMIFELDKMLRFSHENIMQPMGYFVENDLTIIVYDFVPSCTLSQRLHRNSEHVLSWSSRHKIAIAAAQGLTFLHHYCNPPMVHMDVSSNNIFLGPNLEVKVGDVEVTKLLDPTKHTGSISAVAGSFGYIAPEYAFTMRVTIASNVYSFGVVLLELLTGRRPVDESFGDGLDLVKWVHGVSSRGEMPEQVLDARISAQSFASRQEMLSVLKVAVSCTNAAPLKRPRMKKVLEALQEAKSPTELPSPVSF